MDQIHFIGPGIRLNFQCDNGITYLLPVMGLTDVLSRKKIVSFEAICSRKLALNFKVLQWLTFCQKSRCYVIGRTSLLIAPD